MKLLLVLSLVLAMAACSSSTKNSKETSKIEAIQPSKVKKEEKVTNETKSTVSYTCISGGVTRQIKVEQKNSGCAVQYTKDSSTQEIATGSANSPHCIQVVERVKNNLVTAGYTCD